MKAPAEVQRAERPLRPVSSRSRQGYALMSAALFGLLSANAQAQTADELRASEPQATALPQHFIFGEQAAPGPLHAPPALPYDAARGFGWEGSGRFSVRLPEGRYRLSLRLPEGARTTVKAEARRLMLEEARGPASHDIIVDVRTPALPAPPLNAPGGAQVRLTEGELASPSWDDRLTLEFLGTRPAELTIAPADVPAIFLAGDSTVTDQPGEPAASWGQMLPRFLKPQVAVANHAHSGETLKSFLTGLRLDKVLSQIRPGDWLLIQFGHNDQKEQWSQTHAAADSTYPAYLRAYIAEARRRGATPILVTSPERRNFDEAGRIEPSLGGYPEAVRAVAAEEEVPMIDLNAATIAFYEALGQERATLAFNDGGADRTHHNNYGAYELARIIAAGLAQADPRLRALVLPEARSYDPARPTPPERFALPASATQAIERPAGN